jgi:hypothetical protein
MVTRCPPVGRQDWNPMTYRNSEMKLDELIGYFKDNKINLIPPFQRRRVWTPMLRKKLLENMVRGKPIPAIFLYKEEAGSKYSYNILDGKQRLESILLFIASGRQDLCVPNWRDYFFRGHADANFKIEVSSPLERSKKMAFSEFGDVLVRNLREYRIPTIEIDMDSDEGGLNEVIDLFIDINQYGVKVSRFDIVRTMYGSNKLLADVFKMVAVKQRRRGDNFYKLIDSDFTFVLKRLQIVSMVPDDRFQERVDRVWEKLLEIVLFVRSKQHRTLAQILKAFVGGKVDHQRITSKERSTLRYMFSFLRSLYSNPDVKTSRLATDQPHFYTMVTTLYDLDLLKEPQASLKRTLAEMALLIDGKRAAPPGKGMTLKQYMELSSKQTTHPGRRTARQELFVKLMESL